MDSSTTRHLAAWPRPSWVGSGPLLEYTGPARARMRRGWNLNHADFTWARRKKLGAAKVIGLRDPPRTLVLCPSVFATCVFLICT